MKDIFIILFILFVLSWSGYIYVENFSSDIDYVVSDYDSRKYLVRNLNDKKEAANTLAIMRSRLIDFVDDICKEYSTDDRMVRLRKNFNPDNISESPADSKHTSYSVNKGEKIVFCIRQRDDDNNLMDMNTLLFVAIHELAHIMTKSIGHTQEFWDNMKFLLKYAIKRDKYKYQPFHKEPVRYCGTMITDTPYKHGEE